MESLVDETKLAAYLAIHLPTQEDAPLVVTKIGTGHSNETFLIGRGSQEFVLRRPPRGPLLPTAHDMSREYALISGLIQTNLPVPRPILFCADESVLGAPFYLMEHVRGVVVHGFVPTAFADPAGRAELADELIKTLVKLHAVDWQAVGLDKLGKPEGYLERQLKRWSGQLERSRIRELPELDQVTAWLAKNMPISPAATIVHGDFRLDNVMYAPQKPAQVLAVLDWEMATIGDPLADVGYLLSHWREAGDPPPVFAVELANITEQAGFPTRHELAIRYQELSGRPIENLKFYETLAIWKLAILLEGSYVRHKAGTTDDPFFNLLEAGVPALAARALEVCQR